MRNLLLALTTGFLAAEAMSLYRDYTLNNLNPPEGQPAITFEEGVQYTLVLKVPTGGTDSAGKPLDFEAYGARFRPGPAPKIV